MKWTFIDGYLLALKEKKFFETPSRQSLEWLSNGTERLLPSSGVMARQDLAAALPRGGGWMRRPQGGPSALCLSSQWMWLLCFQWLIIEQEEVVRESTVPYVFADLALVWNWLRRPPPPSFIQNSLLTSATYLLHPGACAGMQPYTCPPSRPEAL